MARLSVDLNRDGLHEIAVASSFETDGPFEVRLRNHGEAIHVHLNLDDELSAVARLNETNHYVEPYSQRSVPIETKSVSTPVTGRLKIVTGYGTKSTYSTVRLSPPGTVTEHVVVDESLAKPQRPDPEPPTPREQLAAALPVGIRPAAVGLAVALGAVLATAVISQNSVAIVGSLVLIAGVFAALAFTRRV